MISMKIKLYLQEVYTELIHKVSWPTWKDLQSSAIIVMIASLLIAMTVFFMDITFETMMDFVYKMMH
jgi:preprotein translocase subunit SecE